MNRSYNHARSRFNQSLIFLFVVIALAASACGRSTPTAEKTPAEATGGATSPAPVETTPAPSPTVEPNLVILLAPAGSDAASALAIQNVLGDLSTQDGLAFETRSEFDQVQFEPAARLVVVLPPDPGVANLVAANPNVQFLAVGIDGLQAASNLSLIGAGGSRPDQTGFLAGYLASVITPDWRVGVISPADTVEGKAARLGFSNGVVFFCGLCRPAYPPFIQYPISVDLPAGAGQAEFQAAADQITANAVKTVYLAPGTDEAALVDALAQAGVEMIGSEAPSDALRAHWVASIRFDPVDAIRQIWPKLIGGEGGINASASLVIADVNPDLLSPGRQQWVENLLGELTNGYIDAGVNPETGEPR